MNRINSLFFITVFGCLVLFYNSTFAQSWTPCYNGMFNGAYGVECLEKIDNYLFAGVTDYTGITENGRLYRSSDNGQTWLMMNFSTTYSDIFSMFVSGNELYAGSWQGIYYTSNFGQNWSTLGSRTILAICKSGSNLIVSDFLAALYYSTDNGMNWNPVPSWPEYHSCYTFLKSNNLLYGGGNGLYVSSDDGITWNERGLQTSVVRKLYEFQGALYAITNDSIYKSTNGGLNWYSRCSGINYPGGYSISSINNVLFAGTHHGVYSSSNGGNNWNPAYFGMGNSATSELLASGSRLFACVRYAYNGLKNGLFVTTNNGQNWSKSGFNLFNITSMVLKDNTIFVGTDSSGIYNSSNEGVTWNPARNELRNNYVSCLAKQGADIFAGTADSGVYKSTNNGLNWTAENSGLTNLYIKSFLSNDSVLYSGTNYGIYKTTNKGTNWIYFGLSSTPINSMIKYNSSFLAGTDNGIKVTTNNGLNWILGILDGKTIKAFYPFQNKIYCGTNSGVFSSPDYGLSWSPNGLSSYAINSFSNFADTLACSTSNGVYVSKDSGTNWIWLGPKGMGQTKAILVYNGNILAGGMNNGGLNPSACVWKRTASTVSGINNSGAEIISNYYLYQNYPNPFNPSTIIRYSVSKSGLTKLVVYNILGREVETLVSENQTPGTYEIIFNASQYASGVYFYKLSSGNFIETKKMLLLK